MDIVELYQRIKQSQKWLQPLELKEMRLSQYKMTQVDFGRLLGVSEHTYINWEQGRYTPSSPARSLLLIARDYPDIFLKNRQKLLKLFMRG
jgi:DNA-binding transcriptional regulator YiaG